MSEVLDLLPPVIRKIAEKQGIKEPTPPQELAIPPILEGKHVLVIAPTGSGKTEAAMLPILSRLIEEKDRPGIKAVYVAPLRALNRDMLRRFERWAEELDISVTVRHGDTTLAERRKQSKQPPDMLITTPETLQAILPGKNFRKHLSAVRWVVVDEVHELYGDKRGAQLSIGLERLVELAGEFQRIGLSATVGEPRRVGKFLVGAHREVVIVNATHEKEMEIVVETPSVTPLDTELTEKLGVDPLTAARIRRVKEIIQQHPGCLVFVNTRETAEFLGSKLRLLEIPISVHHGSLARETRLAGEQKFKEGELEALVCTSSMELGLDIGRVSLVIQYSSPRQAVRAIQRIGRAGHKTWRVSRGIILATSPEDALESAVIGRRAKNALLEAEKAHEQALDVLAHQIVGIVLDKGETQREEILSIVQRSAFYEGMSERRFERVLGQLESQRLITNAGEKIKARRKGFEYYYTNLSMIPDTVRYQIRELASRRKIGHLDEEFVKANLYPQTTFVCSGETWKVLEINDEKKVVLVEKHDDPTGAIPAWEGELIPVSEQTAKDVARWRKNIETLLRGGKTKEEVVQRIRAELPLAQEAAEWIVDEIAELLNDRFPVPTDKRVVLETVGNYVVIHVPGGTVINRTLGWVLGELLTARIGSSVRVKTDSYRIALGFPTSGQPSLVRELLQQLDKTHIQTVSELTIKKSAAFRWRLLQVAKRFGTIRKDADLSSVPIHKLIDSLAETPVFEETYREMMTDRLDFEGTANMLNEIKKAEVVEVFRGEPSILAWYLLNQLSGGEVIIPKRAEREILAMVKHRLENSMITLVCLNCLKWKQTTRIKRVDEKPRCKNCGARLLAIVPRGERHVIGLLKKRREGASLSRTEMEVVKRAERTASLVLTHGRKALIALAGRGIGWKTASRILAKSYKTEDDFYKEILRAERTYARTRRFWDHK